MLEGAFTPTGVNTSFSGDAGVHCVTGKHKHGLPLCFQLYCLCLTISSRNRNKRILWTVGLLSMSIGGATLQLVIFFLRLIFLFRFFGFCRYWFSSEVICFSQSVMLGVYIGFSMILLRTYALYSDLGLNFIIILTKQYCYYVHHIKIPLYSLRW